ncbi:MAG: type II toxin-antitoxin system VapC family toxin [Deltaproteobacteria bacterium]|nr:type II toxin-antitoxin system VapC family toxin [Candidatus Tharpella aukensis]
MKNILLDTNCYSAYLTGDERVLNALVEAESVYMSIFVLGELFAGFRGGSKRQQNLDYLKQFLTKKTVKILDATMETAEIFGDLKEKLKKNGSPIPINDVWIAAHALETSSVLITYDAHFQNITGLRRW